LRLIEDPAVEGARLQTHGAKYRNLSFLSLVAWKGRISFLKERFKKGDFRQFNIKGINNILFLSIFILAGYLIIDMTRLREVPNLELKGQGGPGAVDFPEAPFLKKTASYYLEKVMQRSIFKMGMPEEVVEVSDVDVPAGPKAPSSRIIEKAQDLRLVGISWSDDPDAMIEDEKALRTFFVKRGQLVEELKVEAIFKDKVVLSYEGEEIELK